MLTDAIVQAALPCSDFERAKNFYKEKIGVSPSEEDPQGAYYTCAEGTGFFLFPSSGTASGTHTQVGFQVSDIEAEVAELKSGGVKFEEYDSPQLKTENSIAMLGTEKGAWFKDSEGNMLALFQRGT